MNKSKILLSIALIFGLSSCGIGGNEASTTGNDQNYPKSTEKELEQRRGKITGEDGIALVGGKVNARDLRGGGGNAVARGVNAYLWQASLDTISFMPIATVDATGGVIITDWYEDANVRGERMKANVVISSDELKASGVKVSLFRQVAGKGGWAQAQASDDAARKLEDKILTRARELKIEDGR